MNPAVGFCLLLVAPLLAAAPPDWAVRAGHRNAMIVYALVVDGSGHPMTTTGSQLAASEHGQLAGSTPVSIGPKGPVYQLKVGSDSREAPLTYTFYNAKADRIIPIMSGPGFVSGSLVGTIVRPVTLTLKP
jgi:hypothetical protein